MSQFLFVILHLHTLYKIYSLYIYLRISSFFGLVCGSAEQPPLGPSEKALNQPKPHLSDRHVRMCYEPSSGRLIRSAPRRPSTGT